MLGLLGLVICGITLAIVYSYDGSPIVSNGVKVGTYVIHPGFKAGVSFAAIMMGVIVLLGAGYKYIVGEDDGTAKCPRCKGMVGKSFNVCPMCATPLRRSCANCHSELRPEFNACPYCGQMIDEPLPPGTPR